jgi:hypothetical protein
MALRVYPLEQLFENKPVRKITGKISASYHSSECEFRNSL